MFVCMFVCVCVSVCLCIGVNVCAPFMYKSVFVCVCVLCVVCVRFSNQCFHVRVHVQLKNKFHEMNSKISWNLSQFPEIEEFSSVLYSYM